MGYAHHPFHTPQCNTHRLHVSKRVKSQSFDRLYHSPLRIQANNMHLFGVTSSKVHTTMHIMLMQYSYIGHTIVLQIYTYTHAYDHTNATPFTQVYAHNKFQTTHSYIYIYMQGSHIRPTNELWYQKLSHPAPGGVMWSGLVKIHLPIARWHVIWNSINTFRVFNKSELRNSIDLRKSFSVKPWSE